MARGRKRRQSRKSGSVDSATDARTYRQRAMRAVKEPPRSLSNDPLYIGPRRRHDKRALRMVQAAAGGVNIMQSGPAFYHPDFEPSSILLPQDQLEKNAWCFVPDTLVTMADGTRKRIEDIRIGDTVVSHAGRPRKVVEKFVRSVAEEIAVLSVRGTSEKIRCTANHEFKAVPAEKINCVHQKSNWSMCKPGSANSAHVCAKCRDDSLEVLPKVDWDGKIRAGELKKRDCLYEPVYSIQRVVPELQDERLLRLLGYYLAEGCTTKYSVVIVMSREEKDRDHLMEIESLIARLFPKAKATRLDRPERGAVEIRVYSKRFADLCRRYCGRYAHGKRLSQEVVDLPPHLLLPFLGAYANGDGGQTARSNKGILELTTVSVDLASQLVFLLRKCGVPSSHYKQPIKQKSGYIRGREIISRHPTHRVKIRSKYLHILAPHTRYAVRQDLAYRRSAAHHDGARVIRYIDRTDREWYEGQVYNIEVEGEHTYTVGPGLAALNSRHFYKHDPIVATAIDLHAELPLSKIKLSMPKGRDKDKNKRILEYFVRMIGNQGCDLFDKLLQIALEYNKLGNVFAWVQLSDDNRWCESVTLLDPDYVTSEKLEWVNRMTAELVANDNIKSIVEGGPDHPRTGPLYRALPPDIRDTIAAQRNVVLNTDPRRGSHVAHLPRKMSDFDKWGVSLVERCFKNLVYKDRLRQAQDAIAARHMTPKHLIYAEGGGAVDLDQLREQVDAAMNDPDYAIISNYQIVWELIGSSQSFLNVEGEWTYINDEILIGLQMSKAFLQAEATYAGGQTMLAIMEQRYAMFRTVVEDFVYRSIFIPVCEACGYYEVDKDESGAEIKNYLCPQIRWNRLNLTDDTPHKQMLAQMVTEGKVDVGTWLETFGLDPDVVMENVEKEQYTPFDANFQALQQALYASIAEQIAPAMAKKRALEMGIELDLGGEGEEDMPKFGSRMEGTHMNRDGKVLIDTDGQTEAWVAKTLAGALTKDVIAQMRRESGRQKEAETVEERRVERRNRRMERQVERTREKFEVLDPPKRKPPRKDMIRKRKFKEIGEGDSGLKPLLGADADATISEAAEMASDADDFAAGLAASLGTPFANAAARFEEAVVRNGSSVCNVFCPQLVALAATESGTPIEDRIREVEVRYEGKLGAMSDSVAKRLDRASRLSDPTVRERAKRRIVKAAVLGVVKAYGKIREED